MQTVAVPTLTPHCTSDPLPEVLALAQAPAGGRSSCTDASRPLPAGSCAATARPTASTRRHTARPGGAAPAEPAPRLLAAGAPAPPRLPAAAASASARRSSPPAAQVLSLRRPAGRGDLEPGPGQEEGRTGSARRSGSRSGQRSSPRGSRWHGHRGRGAGRLEAAPGHGPSGGHGCLPDAGGTVSRVRRCSV